MKTTDSRDPTLHWELFIRQRGSATQGVPPGKEALTWVANTVTLIWGERDALLVDTFLGDAQTTELADWIEAKGRTLRTIYLTHGHPDHFFGLGRVMHFGRRTAMAEGSLSDVSGKLFAQASTTCLILDVPCSVSPAS